MPRHATRPAALLPLIFAAFAGAQQVGEGTEAHPELPTRFCTKAGGCVTKQTKIVAKAENHNMYWDGDKKKTCESAFNTTSECAFNGDATACTKKCFIEPISNYSTIGVSTKGDALTLKLFMPNSNGTGYTRINPQVHLLAEDAKNYEMFKLVNQELTFDVDMSALTCGLNGALYFSEMEPSGSRSELNPAGAAHGTGYCDAQCFTTPAYINGLANLNKSGSCCNEMDIWEANKVATVFTPHTCSKPSSFLCRGDDECGKGPMGVCDKAGCGINPYKYGSKDFYGEGKTVDTKRPFTVVTQFVHANRDQSDAARAGPLKMIVRKYVQDGRVIASPPVVLPSPAQGSSPSPNDTTGALTQPFCDAVNATAFNRLGGVAGMGDSMARGMVLVFSIWNSLTGDNMNWLDSGKAGPCAPDLGSPDKVLARDPNVSVTFSNIRWGELETTCQGGGNKA
ncbi:hypothetical protein MAPG_09409 [Magnaporthiopsis poae ATCC 64411]|uniref:Glucanase n=1 Tax=Magnaporthiopsis poae (strain ATCC 64411 / 73-15) TaxID=644358 RepID=A0A0C4E9V9_MAGP6|nr:hypothetical protein MAPG_09409 [Magnaporthiopsis poae ATCC 64411]